MRAANRLTPSDAEVLQKVREGNDDEAFTVIHARYEARVMTFAMRHLKDFHRAVEVTQETFYRFFRKITKEPDFWPQEASLAPMLLTIAGSAAVDLLRRERARDDFANKLVLFPRDEPSRPDEEVLAQEIVREVQCALDRLPPELRRVVDLYFVDRHSSKDVARLTHSSLAATRQRITRAREQLVEYLHSYWERNP